MKLPHVLFLDFDGPLFSGKALLLPENNDNNSPTLKELDLHPMVSYWKADPMAIAILHELFKIRPFQLVISSDWADERLHDFSHIEKLLKINRLNIPMHKIWKTPRTGVKNRVQEIAQWLEENPHSDYLILDDEDSGGGLMDDKALHQLKIKKDKVIIVDFDEGISMRNYYQMKAIVANWD
jgi:hypothetical protein